MSQYDRTSIWGTNAYAEDYDGRYPKNTCDLADHLRTQCQPQWADGEECAIWPRHVHTALTKLGLTLTSDTPT